MLFPVGNLCSRRGGGGGGVPTDALMHYTFEEFEPDGTTLADQSGNNNDGTRISSVPIVSGGAVGTNCLDCVDAGDSIDIDGNEPLFPPSQPEVSVSVWVRFSPINTMRVFARGQAHGLMRLECVAGELDFAVFLTSHSWYEARSSSRYDDDAWHHVAGTYDRSAGTISLYVDGSLVAQTTGVPDLDLDVASDPDYRSYLGRFTNYTGSTRDQYYGQMDAFRLFTRVLTPSEISALAAET